VIQIIIIAVFLGAFAIGFAVAWLEVEKAKAKARMFEAEYYGRRDYAEELKTTCQKLRSEAEAAWEHSKKTRAEFLDLLKHCDAVKRELAELRYQRDRVQAAHDFFAGLPVTRPHWTEEDAEQLLAFFKSVTGAKFLEYLRATEQAQNRHAVRNFPHEPAMCGEARGYGLLIRHILQLSESVPPQADANHQAAPSLLGAEELREKFTP
jgi:hypothetical protein